jgi:hypothetical protein
VRLALAALLGLAGSLHGTVLYGTVLYGTVPGAGGAQAGVTAVTRIVNTGTVPGNGGNWASDSFTRTATLTGGTQASPDLCGRSSGPCFRFTASVADQGTFRTLDGALTPNQSTPGKRIEGTASGTVTGRAEFGVFYATAQPQVSLVPTVASNVWASTTWPLLFFPKGTTVTGLDLGPWSLTYATLTECGAQQWQDSSGNGYGDLPFDGNILGCRATRHH